MNGLSQEAVAQYTSCGSDSRHWCLASLIQGPSLPPLSNLKGPEIQLNKNTLFQLLSFPVLDLLNLVLEFCYI